MIFHNVMHCRQRQSAPADNTTWINISTTGRRRKPHSGVVTRSSLLFSSAVSFWQKREHADCPEVESIYNNKRPNRFFARGYGPTTASNDSGLDGHGLLCPPRWWPSWWCAAVVGAPSAAADDLCCLILDEQKSTRCGFNASGGSIRSPHDPPRLGDRRGDLQCPPRGRWWATVGALRVV